MKIVYAGAPEFSVIQGLFGQESHPGEERPGPGCLMSFLSFHWLAFVFKSKEIPIFTCLATGIDQSSLLFRYDRKKKRKMPAPLFSHARAGGEAGTGCGFERLSGFLAGSRKLRIGEASGNFPRRFSVPNPWQESGSRPFPSSGGCR